MSTIVGMPDLNIVFKGLGASAVSRGSKGQAILIVKDNSEGLPHRKFRSIEELTPEVMEEYTAGNVTYIQDALSGAPKELIVVKINDSEENTEDDTMYNPKSIGTALQLVKALAEINCWIAIADADSEEDETLASFVKAQNKNEKKKYKQIGFQMDSPDDMHIVNFTTDKIKYNNDETVYSGKKYIPKMLGAIAGQSLDMSLIAKNFGDLSFVVEPEDKDVAVDNGELFLFNDEGGKIGIGRAVNSLVTTGQGVTNDMKFILIVEVMDLIYSDIYSTWNNSYKGRFKNILDNQMLLIGAINAYFQTLETEYLLDPNFENRSQVDLFAQKMANIPKYGQEEVDTWDDTRIRQMTVGTSVFLEASIKIPNAMEDLHMEISL